MIGSRPFCTGGIEITNIGPIYIYTLSPQAANPTTWLDVEFVASPSESQAGWRRRNAESLPAKGCFTGRVVSLRVPHRLR